MFCDFRLRRLLPFSAIRENVLRKICRENALRVLNQKEGKAERP